MKTIWKKQTFPYEKQFGFSYEITLLWSLKEVQGDGISDRSASVEAGPLALALRCADAELATGTAVFGPLDFALGLGLLLR